MSTKEKAHLSGGPIPKHVLEDVSDFIESLPKIQASIEAERAFARHLAAKVFGGQPHGHVRTVRGIRSWRAA